LGLADGPVGVGERRSWGGAGCQDLEGAQQVIGDVQASVRHRPPEHGQDSIFQPIAAAAWHPFLLRCMNGG
jgi:hypothetical protein